MGPQREGPDACERADLDSHLRPFELSQSTQQWIVLARKADEMARVGMGAGGDGREVDVSSGARGGQRNVEESLRRRRLLVMGRRDDRPVRELGVHRWAQSPCGQEVSVKAARPVLHSCWNERPTRALDQRSYFRQRFLYPVPAQVGR